MAGRDNRNNRHNGGEKKPQRYKGKNVDALGDPMHMERHAVDVFRDMSKSKYNTNNIQEFMNRDFVNSAINVALRNARQQNIVLSALEFSYPSGAPSGQDPDVLMLKHQFLMKKQGWEYIHKTLIGFTYSMDLGLILGMMQQLSTNRDLRL